MDDYARIEREWAEMLDEQDRDYNRKTNALIEKHATTLLAERDAALERERVLREALERLLAWWPTGSENAPRHTAGGHGDDITFARAALSASGKQEVRGG